MGAVPEGEGYRVRVWAPNANAVYIAGSFNRFSVTDHPLARDENGYWTALIKNVRVGDRYRYCIATDTETYMRLDPYSLDADSSDGHTIIPDRRFDWDGDTFVMPEHARMIIYEMHLGTFTRGERGKPGSIENAIAKLDYLHALGVNVLELMPIMEFAGSYSWGYNPSLIFAIESDYGSVADFKRFVRAAHERGMAVILDKVYNHFGPDDLHLWRFDGWYENDKGGIYFYNDNRSHTPWGDTRPDYGRPEVRRYIRDNVLYWLSEYHVDGFRWDAVAYIRNILGNDGDPANDLPDGWSLMQEINDEMKTFKQRSVAIAEDLRGNRAVTAAVNEGGAGFDAQWDALFVHTIRAALIAAEDDSRDMDAVRVAITQNMGDDAFKRVIYTESHDEVANGKARLPEEVDPGKAASWAARKKSGLGAVFVFASPGIPMLFQGQEFLEDDWFHDKDPLDWAKRERYPGILRLYQDLIALRLNRHNCTAGLCGQGVDVFHVDQENKVIAWHRWEHGGPGDSVVIVVNMSNDSREDYVISFPADGNWVVRFNSDSTVYDSEFGNVGPGSVRVSTVKDAPDAPNRAAITLAPYSAVILSQDRI
ncbi:MAG TPA: DUF3459 domain-containing protein [Candidatus Hydrogenedentes bacterium]|nr:DUF3459 domain-containing protein [Candidatus Hydrogenedentota bacterium]